MLPLLISVIPFGLILGALSADKGLSPLETTLMSGLVFAGSAHSSPRGCGSIRSGPRHRGQHGADQFAPSADGRGAGIPYAPVRPRPGYVALFFLADEIWATALRRTTEGPLTPAYYFGLAIPFYISWLFWTTLGALIGGVITHPERYGFDFAFAAVFLVVLFGLWKHQRRLLPIIASAAAALIVWKLAPGVWYIFAGGLAGTSAAILTAGREP